MTEPSAKPVRIGEILVEQGILSEQQVFEIIEVQRRNPKPFGVLAETMFDVTVDSIEQAWIEQYSRFTGDIDLDEQEIDLNALRTIHRRQAWQFEMLPIGFEESGDLLVAASKTRLARAVAFAAQRIDAAVYFRVAESEQLRKFLKKHYPMPEVSEEMIRRARDMACEVDEPAA